MPPNGVFAFAGGQAVLTTTCPLKTNFIQKVPLQTRSDLPLRASSLKLVAQMLEAAGRWLHDSE